MKVDSQLELHEAIPTSPKQNLERGQKRAKKFTMKRLKNLRYSTELKHCLISFSEMDGANYMLLDRAGRDERRELKARMEQYHKNLCQCGGRGLFRRRIDRREATLITALTCSHRLCNICNMLRATTMRKKWNAFFADLEKNVRVRKAQEHMFENIPRETKSISRLNVDEETGEMTVSEEQTTFTSGADLLANFDFMHLTLTVPHGPDGWNGKKYYAKELIKAFNTMRKTSWWTAIVFGGEISVETTRSQEGGLHIHIHALLLTDKRVFGSRNKLLEEILMKWNYLTIDKTRPEEEKNFDSDTEEGRSRIDGIRKGMASCGDKYFNEFMECLDGRGSTMIGIKSLYYELTPEQAATRKKTFSVNGKTYGYCNNKQPKSMVKGVMECLKYHFEPAVLECADGSLDTDFLKEVLPNIYRQRLYGKFGGFYGVKQLNVVEEPVSMDELMEGLAENGKEPFDPVNGLPIQEDECRYVIADSRNISFAENSPHCYLSSSKIRLLFPAGTRCHTAIAGMAQWGYHGEGKKEDLNVLLR